MKARTLTKRLAISTDIRVGPRAVPVPLAGAIVSDFDLPDTTDDAAAALHDAVLVWIAAGEPARSVRELRHTMPQRS